MFDPKVVNIFYIELLVLCLQFEISSYVYFSPITITFLDQRYVSCLSIPFSTIVFLSRLLVFVTGILVYLFQPSVYYSDPSIRTQQLFYIS